MSEEVLARVALVTGASRGIGRAIAEALAARGLAIFLVAEGSEAELAEGEAACLAAGAPAAAHGIFDLGEPANAEAMVAAALDRFGRLDVLVNNAGIRCRKPFGAFTHADFAAVVAVNLGAAFFASQAVLPAMRHQGGGRIIHIASQAGRVAMEDNALYGATKAALIQLTRNMAYELAKDGILVNSVSPGPIATQFNLDSYGAVPGKTEQMIGRVPVRRMGRPEEIAEAVAFLATSEGGFIQGHDLLVDGGYVLA